ncbi:MAG: S8 family serine peptidase [Leptospiraceae bacterium]|nr:S8 family serine peptidase [Leptospiraceae bacterium]NUM40609.1 S8 family serine peptidase [Leptospiraceae bacterium]
MILLINLWLQEILFLHLGFGIGGSIKPDLVAYGGNLSIDHRSRSLNKNGLGVISLHSKFLEGNLFTEDIGTSYSAPYITHLAGRVSSYSKDFSSTLIKALLVASAETNSVKIDESIQKEDSFKLRGYGKVDEEFLFRSSEEVVILYATDFIQNDKNHFYEIPIPEDFFLGNKRKREVTVTLSYHSSARNTRVNYRASRISFRLLRKNSMEEVVKMFNKATSKEDYENIPEYNQNRTISSKLRDKGTVQSSTWELKQPRNSNYYLVVTRNDFSWGEKISKTEEEYSLAIVIKDKEAKEAKLYSQIKEKIVIREKIKL